MQFYIDRFLVVLLFLLITINKSISQSYLSVNFGLNQNLLKTNLSNIQNINSIHNTGLLLGIGYYSPIKKWLSYETQLMFINKNSEISRNSFLNGVYIKNKNSYIQLPFSLLFKLDIDENIKGYLSAGCFLGYLSSRQQKASLPNILAPKDINEDLIYNNIYQIFSQHNIQENYKFNKIDNRIEYGSTLGIKFSYFINKNYGLSYALNHSFSFSEIEKKYQSNQISKKNSTYSMSISLIFNVKS